MTDISSVTPYHVPASQAGPRKTALDLLAQAARQQAAHEWEQAIELLTRAWDAAQASGAERVAFEREILDRRAECRRLQGDLPGAATDLEALARLAAEQGDPAAQVAADLRRARALVRLGEPVRARALAEETLEMARRLGEQRLEAHSLLQIGGALRRLGQFAESERYCALACELAHLLGDEACEAHPLSFSGVA